MLFFARYFNIQKYVKILKAKAAACGFINYFYFLNLDAADKMKKKSFNRSSTKI